MKKIALLLVGIALVLVGLWFALEAGDVARPPEREIPSARPPEPDAGEQDLVRPPVGVAVEALDASGRRNVPSEGPPAIAREAGPTSPPTDPPAGSIAALIVDRDGAPLAGVQVVLLRPRDEGWDVVARGASNDAGAVELGLPGIEPLVLLPALVHAEPPRVRVEATDPPAQPVRFIVGPTAPVLVRTVDPEGAERPALGTVSLVLREAPGFALPPETASGAGARATLTEGRARFPHVGVGFALRVVVDARGWQWTAAEDAGPVLAVAEHVVDVVLDRRVLFVRGRAFDEAGVPLDRARLAGWLQTVGERGDQVLGEWTDGEGRFEGRGGRRFEQVAPECVLELVAARDGEVAHRALVALPTPDAESVLDLGDVVLRSLPLVVSGIVALPDGEPVSNARVGIVGGALSTRSGPDGRFALSGAAPGGTFAIVAREPNLLSGPPVAVISGESRVRVLLRRGARLVGRVGLGADAPLEGVPYRIRVAPRAGDDRAWAFPGAGGTALRVGRLRADGGLDEGPLERGIAVLELDLNGKYVTLRENIELRDGETTDLGTLDPIDRVSVILVTLVDPGGAPLTEGRVLGLGRDDSVSEWPLHADGTVAILATRPAIDLVVEVPDRGTRRFEDVRDGDVLRWTE